MKTNRVQVLMSDDELQALDAWRYANHIASRGEAIRTLVIAGMTAVTTKAGDEFSRKRRQE